MNIRTAFFKLFTAVLLLSAVCNVSDAQVQNETQLQRELFNEIAKQDSILFNAFNKRDTSLFKEYFTADLEFYHDKGGLTGFEQTIGFMRSVTQPGNDLKRELLSRSLEVYPIPGYGAIQTGMHRFCHTENGRNDCGTFKFVQIWQNKNGKWKISRVVSYDH